MTNRRQEEDEDVIEGFTIPGTSITLNTMELIGVGIATFSIFALIYMLMFPSKAEKMNSRALLMEDLRRRAQIQKMQAPYQPAQMMQYQPAQMMQYQPAQMMPRVPMIGYERPWSGPKLKTKTASGKKKSRSKAKPTTIKVEGGKKGNVVLEL